MEKNVIIRKHPQSIWRQSIRKDTEAGANLAFVCISEFLNEQFFFSMKKKKKPKFGL